MSDRALRDEIEVLYTELKKARARADAPLAEELAKKRQQLLDEITALTEEKSALKLRLEELETVRRKRALETSEAKRALSSARSQIASLEPLGNPFEETPANWQANPRTDGCATVVLLGVALSALGWWLA